MDGLPVHALRLKMIPSDRHLLLNARQALKRLSGPKLDEEGQSVLAAVDIVLNEMMLRRDPIALKDVCERGVDLTQEGLALAPVRGTLPVRLEMVEKSLGAASGTEAYDAAYADISTCLDDLVKVLSPLKGAASYLDRVVDWEAGVYAHRMTELLTPGEVAADPRERFTAETFADYLRKKFPSWTDLDVTAFRCIPGGFSKITIIADVTDSVNGPRSLVIRAEPPLKFMELEGADIRNEFPVIGLAFAAGIPVAEPLWLEEDLQPFGMRFIVSRKVDGRTYGTVKSADEPVPKSAVKDIAETLARLHAVDVTRYADKVNASHLKKWAALSSLPENTRAFIEYWRGQTVLSNIGVSPLVTRGLAWLSANVPPDEGRPVLIHGDIGLHNILIDKGRVTAFLDWEISRIGDPAEEMTNLLSGTGGAMDAAEVMDLYRSAGGSALSEYRLRYFDVYHCVKMAICALSSLRRVEDYPSANITFAVFGLRFMHYVVSKMNALIRLAEQARPPGTGS